MPALIAEELEVGLDQVHIEHAPADDKRYLNPMLGFQVTGGSTSVPGNWKWGRAGTQGHLRGRLWHSNQSR
jgi:isoquinoline 1-oxidoreductase beta subunit